MTSHSVFCCVSFRYTRTVDRYGHEAQIQIAIAIVVKERQIPGLSPTAKLDSGFKVPLLLPRERDRAPLMLPTTTSSIPSLLMSPVSIARIGSTRTRPR